jgi:hypothetical protein
MLTIRSISSQLISKNNSDCLGELESLAGIRLAACIHFNMQTRGRNAAAWLSDMQASEWRPNLWPFLVMEFLEKLLACASLCSHTHRYCQAITHSLAEKERERWWSDISCYPWMECWNARAEAAALVDDLLSRAHTDVTFVLVCKRRWWYRMRKVSTW